MKIIVFQGGLGNQLFQYAFYRHLCTIFSEESIYGYYPQRGLAEHNGLEISKWFDVNLPSHNRFVDSLSYCIWFVNKLMRKMNCSLLFSNNDWAWNENALLHDGYWQDKRFCVKGNIPCFRDDLLISDENRKYLKMINQSESVAVHVRRGDYTNPDIQHIYGGICTPTYYREAMERVKSRVENPRFFFFSDEPDYVASHFDLDADSVIVSCNKGEQSFFDMYLMTHAKYLILANSTFSCWAAYLNQEAKMVMCPNKWRNDKPSPDILRDEWIKINISTLNDNI